MAVPLSRSNLIRFSSSLKGAFQTWPRWQTDRPLPERSAEKLRCVPSFHANRDGASGNRIVALLALLAALPQVEMALTKCLVAERDRRLFAYRSDQGVRYLTRHVIKCYLAGSGYGSTFSGTVQLIIMLLRRIARLLQLQLVIHVLPMSPSLAVTVDTDHAWGNYGAMMKEVALVRKTLVD